jgi:signal transduction histidine kinase
MPDYYHTPALILTALLLPAFGYLYMRFRDTRTLLWFVGFLLAVVRMLQHYTIGPSGLPPAAYPWVEAAGETSIQISSALFLASLYPRRFRVGRFNILYVLPYAIPLVICSILFHGVFHDVTPSGPVFLVFPALGSLSTVVVFFWGGSKDPAGVIPRWVVFPVSTLLAGLCLWVCFTVTGRWPLTFVECASHCMTAVLLILVFRRFSPGMLLSVVGFLAWSLGVLEFLPSVSLSPTLDLNLIHIIVLGKVVAAAGMILLALEDELAINKAAQERERRTRLELEVYANLTLSRRRVEDFDRQGEEICQTVVENSRFAQAALLLDTAGRYQLAGTAGLDAATVTALGALAERIPVSRFLAPGSASSAAEHSQTLQVDLTPWLGPGDDLKSLRFTSVLAVPMRGRAAIEGALLLAGRRLPPGSSQAPLHADDLLPVEVLAARLQAARSQTMMLEKLIDSEKFAGLGQLASSVTQQLNNPLTVILGYASLLEEARYILPQERKGVEAILSEARRMRSTLQSLLRLSRPQSDQLAAVSVTEMLADLEQLHRPDFLRRSIEFRLNISPSLPRVMCHPQQLRQAVLHCLQFAIEAVENQGAVPDQDNTRVVRLEATAEGNQVQILVAHSGPGFLHPDRAFDPFLPSQAPGETAGLGLSLCATILRDHNGRASAVNLDPRGAAIILELQAA